MVLRRESVNVTAKSGKIYIYLTNRCDIPMQHSQKCLIVVPAFNEASSVGKVIEALKNVGFNEILVVDDASQDATANVAEAYGANVLTLMERLGAWGATQTGLRYAIRKGYAAVITMDADNQHPANFCHDLLEKLHNETLMWL